MAMRVLLVQTPLSRYDRLDTAPPLGLLILGRIALDMGAEVQLLDFNLECLAGRVPSDQSFYQTALERILAFAPDIVGFTSMGLDSHLGLELAKQIKKKKKDVWCILGGAHFSSIAPMINQFFPWIDAVVEGAGESKFQTILEARKLSAVFPKTNATQAPTTNEQFSYADYSLVNLTDYFSVNPLRLSLIEQGRGCIFSCSFCYSQNHWNAPSIRNQDQLILELHNLAGMGFRKVFFVQDNFLNQPKQAILLAKRISKEKLPLRWQGYATVAQLSEEVIEALAESGCTDLFLGVDAVTASAKKRFSKPLFRSDKDLSRKIRCCIQAGIQPTCAFLLEGPLTDRSSELSQTLHVSHQARLAGANIRLNLLSTYPGTAMAHQQQTIRYSDLKPKLLFDCPSVIWKNKLAKIKPELFPFHNTALTLKDEISLVRFTHTAFTLINLFPKTLEKLLIKNLCGGLVKLISDLSAHCPNLLHIPPKNRREIEIERFHKYFVRNRLNGIWYEDFSVFQSDNVLNGGYI